MPPVASAPILPAGTFPKLGEPTSLSFDSVAPIQWKFVTIPVCNDSFETLNFFKNLNGEFHPESVRNTTGTLLILYLLCTTVHFLISRGRIEKPTRPKFNEMGKCDRTFQSFLSPAGLQERTCLGFTIKNSA